MKNAILAVLLSAIMLLCGCVADTGSITVTALPQASETAEAAPNTAVSFTIPHETKVFARPEELAAIKPLFESYILEDDLFAFAVSAVFNGEAYILGFLYKNNEDTLPFSRVIGLKDNGEIEEAFVSDNYEPDPVNIPENLIEFVDEPFYDTQVLYIDSNLIVITNETLSEDFSMSNVFVLNEKGILCNHVCGWSCAPLVYNGALFFYEDYVWSKFSVQNYEVALKEITDYKPYRPEVKEGDMVIDLKSCTPGTYDEETKKISDDNNIELYINDSEKLALEDFDFEGEYDEELGPCKVYNSNNALKVDKGANIIIFTSPGIRAGSNISAEGPYSQSDFEYFWLPGVTVLKASEAGEYVAVIYTDYENYEIRITAE